MNEYYDIVASTPPDGLAHDTAKAEIERLPTYLRVLKTSPDGTARVVVDSGELGDNTDKVYFARSVTNAIIEDDAVTTDKILDDAVTTGKIPDDAITTAKIVDEAVTGDKLSSSLAFEMYQDMTGYVTQTAATLTASGSLGTIANANMPTGIGNVFCVCPVARTDTAGDTDSAAVRCRVTMFLKFFSNASDFFIAGVNSTELTEDSNAAQPIRYLTVSSPIIGSVYKVEVTLVADPTNAGTTFTTAPGGVSEGVINLNLYGVRVAT